MVETNCNSKHQLTSLEKGFSETYSNRLGQQVILYQDGDWICEAVHRPKKCGTGATPALAYSDFLAKNNIVEKKKK